VVEAMGFRMRMPANDACTPPARPVYRLYNNPATLAHVNHRFTVDGTTYNALRGGGWIDEGVGFCAKCGEASAFPAGPSGLTRVDGFDRIKNGSLNRRASTTSRRGEPAGNAYNGRKCRKSVRSLSALGAAAAFAFAATALADVTIGVTISTTGPAASLGIPQKNTV